MRESAMYLPACYLNIYQPRLLLCLHGPCQHAVNHGVAAAATMACETLVSPVGSRG
jgi:hypothetical protein